MSVIRRENHVELRIQMNFLGCDPTISEILQGYETISDLPTLFINKGTYIPFLTLAHILKYHVHELIAKYDANQDLSEDFYQLLQFLFERNFALILSQLPDTFFLETSDKGETFSNFWNLIETFKKTFPIDFYNSMGFNTPSYIFSLHKNLRSFQGMLVFNANFNMPNGAEPIGLFFRLGRENKSGIFYLEKPKKEDNSIVTIKYYPDSNLTRSEIPYRYNNRFFKVISPIHPEIDNPFLNEPIDISTSFCKWQILKR